MEEQPKIRIPDLVDHVTDLAEKKAELILLNVTEKTSRIVSSLSIAIVLVVFGLFIVLFAGLSCGWWLSELTGSAAMGFLFTTLIFVLLFLVVGVFGRKFFQNMVINWLIKGMLYDK